MLIQLSLFEESELIHHSKTGDFCFKETSKCASQIQGFLYAFILKPAKILYIQRCLFFFIAVEENITFFFLNPVTALVHDRTEKMNTIVFETFVTTCMTVFVYQS